MKFAIVGVLTNIGVTILKFAILYFVIKYAVKSAIKESR